MVLPMLKERSTLGGLVEGVGEGVERALPSIYQMIASHQQLKRDQEKFLAKQKEAVIKRTPKHLKDFYPALADNPEARRRIAESAQRYAEEGLPESEAIEAAVREFKSPKQPQSATQQFQGEEPKDWRDFFGELLIKSQQEPARQHPLTTLETERPGATLGSLGIGAIAPFEEVARYQSKPAQEFIESLGFTYPEGSERGQLVTEKLREKLQSGLSPQAKKAAGEAEFAGAFLPAERLLGGLKLIGKSAGFLKNAEKIAAREGIEVAEAIQKISREAESAGIDLAKVAAGDKQSAGKLFNLSNRISAKAPETATELRIARAEPKAKMFPKEERIGIREEQLKSFQRYEAEIAQDASERAARAEAKIPKTVKGMDAKRLRVHAAEKNLPVAEKGYRNALARTRAIEDEIVKLKGAEKERYAGLLEAAKKEQRDAEFFLKQTMQNISGGEARVGLEEMRKAAQDKMLKIADQIAAGKEVKLAKMDYNPQMVQEAKRLSKKKGIPSVKKDDFYQQVHKEYGDQYRNQLARIEKQIKDLPQTMVAAEQIRNLQKEKEVLKKLIDQTEAERAIHQHKLSLRETAERHKAKERLGKLQKQEAQPKVQKVAQEKIREALRNPMGKETEELIEQAVKETKSTNLREQIIKEKTAFQKALEKVNQETELLKSSSKSTTQKNAAEKGIKIAKDISELIEAYKKSPLSIFKTKIGHDILLGIGAQLLTEVAKEFDMDVPQTAIISALIGSPRGAGYRYLVGWATRAAINSYKKENYKKAVRKGDDQKVADLRKKYSSRLIKEARNELISS